MRLKLFSCYKHDHDQDHDMEEKLTCTSIVDHLEQCKYDYDALYLLRVRSTISSQPGGGWNLIHKSVNKRIEKALIVSIVHKYGMLCSKSNLCTLDLGSDEYIHAVLINSKSSKHHRKNTTFRVR